MNESMRTNHAGGNRRVHQSGPERHTVSEVKRVHVVFKTHLDIGFTDFARHVLRRYLDSFLPRAIELTRRTRESGGDRFIWTTGSWLIYEYLERSSPARRRQMEEAIAQGDIYWHGLPFTTHSELMDAELFRSGLALAKKLDRRFGRQTIAAKMTDVPGHTRAIVPLLAEAGIKFLHIGVNPASTPPAVPPVFVWRDPSGSDLIVMYQRTYGDAMVIPHTNVAVAITLTGDNHGPPSPDAIAGVYSRFRERFPEAEIRASTLDMCAADLLRIRNRLPVVTQEIGDTWIHGVGTDPKKVAQFRELSRLRREWLSAKKLKAGSDLDFQFSRSLLLVAEHTWGMDIKTHLRDFRTFRANEFQAARRKAKYRKVESSWMEQRAYVGEALKVLKASPLAVEARRRLARLAPRAPAFFAPHVSATTAETSRWRIRFDGRTGAIIGLQDKRTGREWATLQNPVGLFRYETFSSRDYDRFLRQYITHRYDWAIKDFSKPGMESARAMHRFWSPRLRRIRSDKVTTGHRLVLELTGPAVEGCPRRMTMEIVLPDDDSPVEMTFQWYDKPANRLPEALWLSFMPRVAQARGWTMHKLGCNISPLDVVRNGNRKLHAVGEGVAYRDQHGRFVIESLDCPLVAPGDPSLLDFNNCQPRLLDGMHFNLYNNVWGTNFPMWYDEDARFRFRLRF